MAYIRGLEVGQYHGCWCPGSFHHQATCSHTIVWVQCGYTCLYWKWISTTSNISGSTKMWNIKNIFLNFYQKKISAWQELTRPKIDIKMSNTTHISWASIYWVVRCFYIKSCEVYIARLAVINEYIALEFDKFIGSIIIRTSVKFQSDWTTLNPYLAP